MNYSTLLIEKKENIGTITFNRPDKLNALSTLAFQEFIAALHEVDQDNEVRVVIITGAGRAFSAGLDLEEATKGRANPICRQRLFRTACRGLPKSCEI